MTGSAGHPGNVGLDRLLAGADPRAALAEGGLLDGLKRALAERGLTLLILDVASTVIEEATQVEGANDAAPLPVLAAAAQA